MNKHNVITNVLNNIIKTNLVNCCFTNYTVYETNDSNIEIYCVSSDEKYNLFTKYQESILANYNSLLHLKNIQNGIVGYYEDGTIIRLYTYKDLNFQVYGKIYSLYDPYNLLSSFRQKSFAFTNNEFANKINELCVCYFEYCNSIQKSDKLLSYYKAMDIRDIFVDIYRGFYDSLNARKGYKDTNLTMQEGFKNNLNTIIKSFTFDNYQNAIKLVTIEMDKIISGLPVNVVALFDIDFYNYTNKIINNIL